jgi:hypothetical protein
MILRDSSCSIKLAVSTRQRYKGRASAKGNQAKELKSGRDKVSGFFGAGPDERSAKSCA